MAQTFALKRLLEIAETTAESAAASLGALNRQLQQHEEKLMLLFKYRDEYQQRLRHAAGSAGLDGAGLRNYHEFLERLEQAILQQHALVVEARTRVECGRTDWQLKQKKSKAFGTLAQRFDVATQRDHASREQKLQDDFASRTSRAKHHAHCHASATTAKNRR
jgi:flagellar FliJ protein